MNRPWMIWSLSALCALLVFGAMGVITRHTLSLENDRAQAEAEAELEERIRLALWRMDSAAVGILAEEYRRPASQFRNVDVNLNDAENISNVKLHFEVKDGVLSSPQKGSEWSEFSKNVYSQNQSVTGVLKEAGKESEKKSDQAKQYGDSNLDVIRAVAEMNAEGDTDLDPDMPNPNDQIDLVKGQRAASSKSDLRNSQSYQTNYNRAEKVKRQEIVGKSVGKKGSARKSEGSADKTVFRNVTQSKDLNDDRNNAGDGSASNDGKRTSPGLSGREKVDRENSPLTPLWLDQDLILVREVSDHTGKRVQGVWLDADTIEKSLLQDINDLLPRARLEPVRRGLEVLLGEVIDPNADDPMVMAALPWRLIPGEVVSVESGGWTPMSKNLAVAWVGVALAVLAAVVLLRGVVKLSERRASFVSSVTHELRTPLTTFSLYSDMLAEGMVRDEEKQQEYLTTLRRESGRLTHLVENVLAYSRIERGSARARVESVAVGDLLDRMQDRLKQRAEEAGMELLVDVPEGLGKKEVEVDTTAVEQIIFNLVDNAGKYANGEEFGSQITLRVLAKGKRVAFQVCDQGPGIQPGEQRRLFRAFHKSAKEAAHSKPGVGLGLALSRRLARALGGDLKIIPQKSGACFELSLK